MSETPQNFPEFIRPRNNSRNLPNTPLDSRAFLPAYIRARRKWGQVFDAALVPLLSNQQNPTLPPFSLNAPLGSDFQNFYPALYNEEKSAIATVLGSLNPIGTANSSFRQWQLNDDILLTSNVNSIEYSLLIDKDNVNLISWAIHFSQSGDIYFEVAPIGSNQLVPVASFNTDGWLSAGNYPPEAVIPQIGGWSAPGTYTWNAPSWVAWLKAYVTGAGGGGGAGYRGYSGGGAGASGGTIIGLYQINTAMNPFTVIVGAGGYAGMGEGAAGGQGEVSSFYNNNQSVYIGAWGGNGGYGGGANQGNGGGPIFPAGSGGVLQFPGTWGGTGTYVVFPTNDTYGAGGNGPPSYWGGGGWGAQALANYAYAGGVGYVGGGGGGGACCQVTGYTPMFGIGGPGGGGIVMLEMYP